jgi:DNA helicase-2/ATP-dependent DNA helicase PcrA
MKQQDQIEERRLAYVGFTRAQHEVVLSGHWWGPTQVQRRGPSEFLLSAHEHCAAGGGTVDIWEPPPAIDATNPALERQAGVSWPPELDEQAQGARAVGAALVRSALVAPLGSGDDSALDPVERARVDDWDVDLDALLAEVDEVHRPNRSVPLPTNLSASSLVRLSQDRAGLARDLARPMPRRPTASARRGTRFHQWVESRFGQSALIDLDDLASDVVEDDTDLQALQEAFLAGPYADRVPLAVEAPFQLVLADQVISGRIDAVYRTMGSEASSAGQSHFDIVDWKSGRSSADALQLAIYRLAWAELQRVPLENVHAAFYYVARGQVERADDLPDRDQLTAILTNDVVV